MLSCNILLCFLASINIVSILIILSLEVWKSSCSWRCIAGECSRICAETNRELFCTTNSSNSKCTIKSNIACCCCICRTLDVYKFNNRTNRKIVWKFSSNICGACRPICSRNKSKVSLLIYITNWTITKVSLNFCISRTNRSIGLLKNKSITWWSCINRTGRLWDYISYTVNCICWVSIILLTWEVSSWCCCSKWGCSKTYNLRIDWIFSCCSWYLNIPLRIGSIILNWVTNITRVLIRYSTYNT